MPLSSFPPVASSRSASVMIARAGIILCAARNEMTARLPLQRVYLPSLADQSEQRPLRRPSSQMRRLTSASSRDLTALASVLSPRPGDRVVLPKRCVRAIASGGGIGWSRIVGSDRDARRRAGPKRAKPPSPLQSPAHEPPGKSKRSPQCLRPAGRVRGIRKAALEEDVRLRVLARLRVSGDQQAPGRWLLEALQRCRSAEPRPLLLRVVLAAERGSS
jgi:hypothetical protein